MKKHFYCLTSYPLPLVLLLSLWPQSAFSKCRPNGGKIGYSYCVRFSVESIESASSLLSKIIGIRNEYESDRVLTAKILQVNIPSAELQAKDAATLLKAGTSVRVGVHRSDGREFKVGQELNGLWEKGCYDTGDPSYELEMNPKLNAIAYESSGTIRGTGHKISCEDKAIERMSDFKVIDPYEDEERLRCANHWMEDWVVDSSDGNVQIQKLGRNNPTESTLYTYGGVLIGTDHGEFGGKLVWKNGQEQVVLHNANITGLVDDGEYVYAVGGVAHMSTDKGYALKLKRKDGKFIVEKTLKLNSRPAGVVRIDAGKLAVAGNQGVQLIENDSVKQLSLASVSVLYPNSVAIDEAGDIYVGMRFAVAKFEKNKQYRHRWLVKGDCLSYRNRPIDPIAQKEPRMLTK